MKTRLPEERTSAKNINSCPLQRNYGDTRPRPLAFWELRWLYFVVVVVGGQRLARPSSHLHTRSTSQTFLVIRLGPTMRLYPRYAWVSRGPMMDIITGRAPHSHAPIHKKPRRVERTDLYCDKLVVLELHRVEQRACRIEVEHHNL